MNSVHPVMNSDLDNITKIVNNPEEYKEMIIDILSNEENIEYSDIIYLLRENIINDVTDMKLRAISTEEPYNFLIPLLRQQLGLCIETDDKCVEALINIRDNLFDGVETVNKITIDKIISFLQNNSEELDDSFQEDLLAMLEHLPLEMFSTVFNSIDYLNEITEDM